MRSIHYILVALSLLILLGMMFVQKGPANSSTTGNRSGDSVTTELDGSPLLTLSVKNWSDFERVREPVTSGIPLPKGKVREADELKLVDSSDREIPLAI